MRQEMGARRASSRMGVLALAGIGMAACTSIADLGGEFGLKPTDDAGLATTEAGTSTSSSSSSGSNTSSSSTSSSTSSTGGEPDAGTPDTGTPDTGSPDAGIGDSGVVDAGSPPWCTGKAALYCSDFSSSATDFGWGGSYTAHGLLEAPGAVGDPARELRATVDSAPSNQSPGALLMHSLAAEQHPTILNGETLTIRFEVKVTSGGTSTYAIVGGLELGNQIPYGLAVGPCSGTAACFLESDGTLPNGNDRAPTNDRFPIDPNVTYQAQVTITNTNGTLSSTVGVGALGGPLTTLASRSPVQDFAGATSTIVIIAGAGFAGTNGTATVSYIDNFIVTN